MTVIISNLPAVSRSTCLILYVHICHYIYRNLLRAVLGEDLSLRWQYTWLFSYNQFTVLFISQSQCIIIKIFRGKIYLKFLVYHEILACRHAGDCHTEPQNYIIFTQLIEQNVAVCTVRACGLFSCNGRLLFAVFVRFCHIAPTTTALTSNLNPLKPQNYSIYYHDKH